MGSVVFLLDLDHLHFLLGLFFLDQYFLLFIFSPFYLLHEFLVLTDHCLMLVVNQLHLVH